MHDFLLGRLRHGVRARLHEIERECEAGDAAAVVRLREICARPYDEAYVLEIAAEQPEVFAAECRALVTLIEAAAASQRTRLTALFLAWRSGALLGDRLRARLEQPVVEKLSPFVYAMQ